MAPSEEQEGRQLLSEKMIDKLNKQIALEMYSSHIYLQAGSWAIYRGYPGCASFLAGHADEEMAHGRRLLTYLHETGAKAVLTGIDAPPESFESLPQLFKTIYDHECLVTTKINELVHLATAEPDYSTLNFLQWYVAEQHEEEFLFQGILDLIDLIGTEGQGNFFIDREVAAIAARRTK